MSLILDALKQADRERTRGAVPGVFGQPTTSAEPLARGSGRRPLAWLLATAVFGGGLWLAWPHLGRSDLPAPAMPTAALAPVATPSPVIVPPQPSPPAGALFRPGPTVIAPPALPERAPAATDPSGRSNPIPTATGRPPAEASAAQAPSAAELPAEVRSQLPSVQVTGHTYSDNPTLRMLMIDGHMVVEGQAISPGLRLERIGPHQAIFNHRGTRFSVAY